MVAKTATKMRESSPDSVLFTLNGSTSGMRQQVNFSRKLPADNASVPALKTSTKVTIDREIKDSTGAVKYVQPQILELTTSFNPTLTPEQVQEAAEILLGAFKDQFGKIESGLLPDVSFVFQEDESVPLPGKN